MEIVNENQQENNQINRRRNTTSTLLEREARKDIMSNTDYRRYMRNLNEAQRQIIMYTRSWCKTYVRKMRQGKVHNGFRIYLGGPGGCGKSFIIKLIRRDVIYFLQQTMRLQPDEPLVLLTAPTGLAAFNIDGITLHSAFMLHSNDDQTMSANWEKKSAMHIKLHNLALCIIDEISMVGSSTFKRVSETLKKIKCNTNDWGGICILAVGDFYQLPPIGQYPVYMQPTNIRAPGDLSPPLWNDFLVHELDEVMRQKNKDFAHALNKIRKAVPEKDSSVDFMLRSCEMNIPHTDPAYPINAMHVYAQNKHCAEWNNTRLDSIQDTLYTNNAHDVSKDGSISMSQITITEKLKETANLPKTVNVKIGARVMLTCNIDVSDGLTNGAMGTVTGIVQKQNNTLHVILVKFDSDKVGDNAKSNSIYKDRDSDAVPIKKWQGQFKVKKHHVRVLRTQFPIILCWAVTIHKCQGMTSPEIVVDMHPKKGTFKDGQAYVAFSRVTSLDKLHIINYTREQIRVSRHVQDEMCVREDQKLPPQPKPRSSTIDRSSHTIILHLNVAGLLVKQLDIKCDDYIKQADVICFNETHLSSQHTITPKMLGFDNEYIIFRKDRNEHGGGVMILAHKRLNPKQLLTSSNLEIIIIKINVNKTELFIISVYKSQIHPTNTWTTKMKHLLHLYTNQRLCIMGDMNEDLFSHHSKPITTMFTAENMKQHVYTATRDSGTLIDHVYTNNITESHVFTETNDCYYSDHDIVTCIISNNM